MKALTSIGLAVGLAITTVATSALATPVLEFNGGILAFTGGDVSAGWSFTTNEAITVIDLDAYDPTGDGTSGHVRIYNGSGTVLASAAVTTSDPQEGSPTLFYSQAISPVTLAANTTYYIAEDLGITTRPYVEVGSLTTNPAITFGHDVLAFGQGQDPTGPPPGQGIIPNSIFGPDFDIAPTSIPEPWTLGLFGTGLAALFLMRRRSKTLAS